MAIAVGNYGRTTLLVTIQLLATILSAGSTSMNYSRGKIRNEDTTNPGGNGFSASETLVLPVGGKNSATENKMEISLEMDTGKATISVDDEPWFNLAGGMRVVGWNRNTMLRLISTSVIEETREYNKSPLFGPYTNVTFVWSTKENPTGTNSKSTNHQESDDENIIHTSFLVFQKREIIVFEQFFETGWEAPLDNHNPATDSNDENNFDNVETHNISTNDDPLAIIAGFPSVILELPKDDLGFLWWGGCFAAETFAGSWNEAMGQRSNSSDSDSNSIYQYNNTESTKQMATLKKNYNHWFDGNEHGQPWVLHNEHGRTVIWSSLDNFFVSGFAARSDDNCEICKNENVENDTNTLKTKNFDVLEAGLRTTLLSIPKGHTHATILVGGTGINATMMEWGDVLLKTTGGVVKNRTNVYDDFTLAHLGYWTDNGAYHYNGAKEDQYKTMEASLLGVKEGMEKKKIPIRYIQWDDWWMEKNEDFPGMISWTPKPDVFPSGFSDWLDMPLAMYAPAYFAENVWRKDYSWKVDHTKNTSIPTDPRFYKDLFQNGTSIGMKFFEQDFLCSLPWAIGSTSLTTTDLETGKNWFLHMDRAAKESEIKLQFCMADVYHILQATSLPTVTNARATEDNTRNVETIKSMGQNSLLFYATGIYASRDNVWTSDSHIEQIGCGNRDFCYEPNAHLDNAVAVLSNGPYGIADGLAYVNDSLVHKSCRSDGLLLRPRWPISSLDFTFTDPDAKNSLIWAAHDDHGGNYRWSYVIGVDIDREIAITPKRLMQGLSFPVSRKMLAWEVVLGKHITCANIFSESSPFLLPKSKPLDLPYSTDSPPHTHYATAPVMPNGMVLLGEVSKWATMSFGRVVGIEIEQDFFVVDVHGAPSEVVVFAYIRNATLATTFKIEETKCSFPSTCSETGSHGNPYCQGLLFCDAATGCSCDSRPMNEKTFLKGSHLPRQIG